MKFRIRKLEESDLEVRRDWFNNPRIYSQMPLDIPFSLSETKQWFQSIIKENNREDFCAVQEEPTRRLAMCGLTNIDLSNDKSELYLLTNPSHFSEGIGSATLHWLCNYAFVKYNLNKIYLYTLESNTDARNFYEKNGFIEEAKLSSHTYNMGDYVDRYIHRLLRSEWIELDWHNPEVEFEVLIE